MRINKKKVGIICGGTDLAEILIRSAIKENYDPVIIAVKDEADDNLSKLFKKVHWLQIGDIGKSIEIFKKSGVAECIMIGRVDHRRIFENINFDEILYKIYESLKDHKANTLLEAFTRVFEQNGIKFIDSTKFLKKYLAPKGIIGEVEPDESLRVDIAFGWSIAKKMGELDIGQTVVVKDKMVVAVEAIEGTDELIKRTTMLCPSGAIIVKVAKPDQDVRFDVPVVGPNTIHRMAEASAAAVAVEAGKTIIVDLEETVRLANEKKIVLIGIDESVVEWIR